MGSWLFGTTILASYTFASKKVESAQDGQRRISQNPGLSNGRLLRETFQPEHCGWLREILRPYMASVSERHDLLDPYQSDLGALVTNISRLQGR
ncbi:MAG: hypothetical protein OHK0012_02680 [Synechococcales cyanobacterium]